MLNSQQVMHFLPISVRFGDWYRGLTVSDGPTDEKPGLPSTAAKEEDNCTVEGKIKNIVLFTMKKGKWFAKE